MEHANGARRPCQVEPQPDRTVRARGRGARSPRLAAQRGTLGPILLVLVVLVTGCSGSEAERPEADADRQRRDATTAPSPPPAEPMSLPAWRGAFGVWLDETRAALREIGLTANDPRAARELREQGFEDFRDGMLATHLESLRTCARLEETLTPAPRRALAAVRLLRRSCSHFARGADLTETGIDEDSKAALGGAVRSWRTATNLVEAANRKLPRPDRVEALPLPVEDGSAEISRIEPLFTRATRTMSKGARFAARCWSVADWTRIEREAFGKKVDLAGFATARYSNLNLAPGICASLAGMAYRGERPTGVEQLDAAFAVVVLMHETAHLAEGDRFFTREEAAAECWAMQFVRPAARALGVEDAYASELAERYWEEVYPLVERKYRSPECRNGGRLDARRGSDVWP